MECCIFKSIDVKIEEPYTQLIGTWCPLLSVVMMLSCWQYVHRTYHRWIGVTTAGCVTVVITLPVTQRPVSQHSIHSAIFIMTGGRVALLLALLLGCCLAQNDNSTAVPSTNTTAAVAANTTADATTSATASNATTTTAATTETTTTIFPTRLPDEVQISFLHLFFIFTLIILGYG